MPIRAWDPGWRVLIPNQTAVFVQLRNPSHPRDAQRVSGSDGRGEGLLLGPTSVTHQNRRQQVITPEPAAARKGRSSGFTASCSDQIRSDSF